MTSRGRLGEEKTAKLATELMETTVYLKSDRECASMLRYLMNFNAASMLCAHKMKTDACQGDSGIVKLATEFYILNI